MQSHRKLNSANLSWIWRESETLTHIQSHSHFAGTHTHTHACAAYSYSFIFLPHGEKVTHVTLVDRGQTNSCHSFSVNWCVSQQLWCWRTPHVSFWSCPPCCLSKNCNAEETPDPKYHRLTTWTHIYSSERERERRGERKDGRDRQSAEEGKSWAWARF